MERIPDSLYVIAGFLILSNLGIVCSIIWGALKLTFKIGSFHAKFEIMQSMQKEMKEDLAQIKLLIEKDSKDVHAAHSKIREIESRIPTV